MILGASFWKQALQPTLGLYFDKYRPVCFASPSFDKGWIRSLTAVGQQALVVIISPGRLEPAKSSRPLLYYCTRKHTRNYGILILWIRSNRNHLIRRVAVWFYASLLTKTFHRPFYFWWRLTIDLCVTHDLQIKPGSVRIPQRKINGVSSWKGQFWYNSVFYEIFDSLPAGRGKRPYSLLDSLSRPIICIGRNSLVLAGKRCSIHVRALDAQVDNLSLKSDILNCLPVPSFNSEIVENRMILARKILNEVVDINIVHDHKHSILQPARNFIRLYRARFSANPAPIPQNGKVPPRRVPNADVRSREYLTPAETDALMQAARKVGRHGHRDTTLILIAYRHGFRVSELVSLRWDQVDCPRA